MSSPDRPENLVWTLKVRRTDLARALRTVGRAGRSIKSAHAVLTLEDHRLVIDLAGNVASPPAEGEWPGEVRLRGCALERLAKVLPREDPLVLRAEDGRFSAARFSVPCERRGSSRPTPVRDLVPPNADLFEILMIRSRCSAEEIDAAGAAGLVAEAERRLDAACAAGARTLSRYGVTARHLRALCAEHAMDGTRKFRENDGVAIKQIARVWEILAPLGVEPDELKALMDDCLKDAWKK